MLHGRMGPAAAPFLHRMYVRLGSASACGGRLCVGEPLQRSADHLTDRTLAMSDRSESPDPSVEKLLFEDSRAR
eukprot:6205214-Prymnesium_polylepis.2